jgi:phage recombination protein Bet
MTSTDLATTDSHGTLALSGGQTDWTPVQRAALDHLGIAKAPTGDQQVFLHVAQRTGLDPFAKQIYMIERGGKWTIQTAIDGFRLIADRRPEYAGQSDPEWCGEDGQWTDFWAGSKPPVAARVRIYRSDWQQPATGTVMFTEYTAGNAQWRSKPAHMLAKCAEALALRKAFPNDLSGLYTDDEMAHVDQPARTPRRTVIQAEAAPVTAADITGGTSVPQGADVEGRMTKQQQGKLFALLGESEVDDRKAWASGVLGRDITSYGQLG